MASPTAPAKSVTAATNGQALATANQEPTISQKFLAKVQRQLRAVIDEDREWTPLEKALGQNMFLHIDSKLRALEAKRQFTPKKQNNPPITWENVDQEALSLRVQYLISLGLDASIPNHVAVTPFLNSKTQKYEVPLLIGYAGQDYIRRHFAIDVPLDIKYQLVHEGDEFDIRRNPGGGEEPIYKPKDYFRPGEVIGGFGHILYADSRKNRVIVCEYREFEKAKNASANAEFWGGEQFKWVDGKKVSEGFDSKFEKEMQYKTLVLRVCKKIAVDPAKVYGIPISTMEAQIDEDIADAQIVVDTHQGLTTMAAPSLPEPTSEPIPAPAMETEPADDLGY